MARKRLTPARPAAEPEGGLETKAFGLARPYTRAPIARVAGESAAEAALAELSGEIGTARAEGRLVQALPLEAVEAEHLVRDRLSAEEPELAALKGSLAARGQQTPIEVVELEEGRFGLISGWRRVRALTELHAETGEERFARVLALLRRPESAADAYQAMVEENEIRVGLSYWERARIAARAAEAGVFTDEQTALRVLFAQASRARRSKIGSFLTLVRALDGAVRFPAAIPERLGLRLARALSEDPGLAERLRKRLAAAVPDTAEAEQNLLEAALAPAPKESGVSRAKRRSTPKDKSVSLERTGAGRVVLSGPGVDETFLTELEAWLAARG